VVQALSVGAVSKGAMGCRESACLANEAQDIDHDYKGSGHRKSDHENAEEVSETQNVIGREAILEEGACAEQDEPKQQSPRSQGELEPQYGKSVIGQLSKMKEELWHRFDKDKDGLLSSREALSFVRLLLKQFLSVLASDLPHGTAEKATFDRTAPDSKVQKQLAQCFLEKLDADNDGQTTRDEFFSGFEVALRHVLDQLFLLHFKGNQEAMELAQPELILFINSPGLNGENLKIQIPKFKTVSELRSMLEGELGIAKSEIRMWNGFTRLTEISSALDLKTLQECSKELPPLRNFDVLHIVGGDGLTVSTPNRLYVSVMRVKMSRGFGNDSISIELEPDWAAKKSSPCVVTTGAITVFDPTSSSFEWALEPGHLQGAKASLDGFSVRMFRASRPAHVAEAYLKLESVLNEPKLCEVLGPYGQGRFFETPVALLPTEQSRSEMKARPTYVVLKFGYLPSER